MPNWCSTRITLVCGSEDEANKIHKIISDSFGREKNGFGDRWLGNVVLACGLGTVDAGTETDVRCRGEITYIDTDFQRVDIDTETAWEPMLTMWQLFRDKYVPNAKIIYTADEPGCGLHWTNSQDDAGMYVVDYHDAEIDVSEYMISKERAIELLRDISEMDSDDIDKMTNAIYEREDWEWFECYSYEYDDSFI